MPISIVPTRRVLRYNGVTLNDLPGQTLEQMRQLHCIQYPELMNAEIVQGPVIDGVQEITYQRTVGTKA